MIIELFAIIGGLWVAKRVVGPFEVSFYPPEDEKPKKTKLCPVKAPDDPRTDTDNPAHTIGLVIYEEIE